MNAIRQRRAFLWQGLFFAAVALAISPLLGDSAHAVSITGSTYASENGGPTPNPTSKSYNLSNLSSVSASIRSDVEYAHAESYASAMVTANGVVKTTGGLAWTDVTSPTTLLNNRGDVWNASATGTTIQANYTGNGTAPNSAPFQFSLPASIAQSADPYYSNPAPPPAGYTDPTSLVPQVSGGMVAQGVTVNGGGNSLPSFFDVFVTVEASAFNGTTTVPLFNGSYEFNPSTGAYTPSGNFMTDVFGNPAEQPEVVFSGSAHSPSDYSLVFPQDILGNTFQAPVGSPFTVDIDTSVSMGDPGNPGNFNFSGLSDPDGVLGAGGSVTGQFLLTDPSDFSVSAVPEPSAICLAAFAAAGLMLQLRRRKQS